MNHDTSHHRLPSLVAHVINDGTHYIDNLFASAWNSLNLNRRLEAAGFAKRSGIEVTETVFVLMVWRWLNVSSIAVFCRTALSVFSRAKKDVLYDFLKREDIHWRKLNLHTAKEVYRQHALHHSQVRAYVLDDSIKARHRPTPPLPAVASADSQHCPRATRNGEFHYAQSVDLPC